MHLCLYMWARTTPFEFKNKNKDTIEQQAPTVAIAGRDKAAYEVVKVSPPPPLPHVIYYEY
jgi:hypothetical protein